MAQFGLNLDPWLSSRFEGKRCFCLGLSFLLIKWEFGAMDPMAILGVLDLVPTGLRVDTSRLHGA